LRKEKPSLFLEQVQELAAKECAKGTHRICTPEETLRRVTPLMARFGITRVANVTGLDRLGVPVMMVCRPNSRSVSVSQGKGLTESAARASGVMEAIELYHAENIRLPLRYASREEMVESFETLQIEDLVCIAGGKPDGGRSMLWLEGYDLLSSKPVWVPYETVSLDTTVAATPGGECFLASSNGLASGNHILEAIVHGLCEVVERDATTLWYLMDSQSRAERRIENESVDDAECRELLNRFESAGMETMIWDVSSDIGLPVFLALITDRYSDPGEAQYTSIGYGCHLSRRISLQRALTEAAQSRLTLIAGSRDDIFREEYDSVSPRSIDSFRFLRPKEGPWRAFHEVTSQETVSVREDLAVALVQLRQAGAKHVAVVDLTGDAGIPVVRVIVPGLEGPIPGVEGPRMASGFAPGRRASQVRAGER
jgi:YcaO-like protein with predicted kinase domain